MDKVGLIVFFDAVSLENVCFVFSTNDNVCIHIYIYIYCIYIVNVPTPPVIQVGNGQSTMIRSFSAFAQTCGCPIASSAIFDF